MAKNEQLTLDQLEAQIAELTVKANEIRAAEKQKAIAEVRELVRKFGITAREIGLHAEPTSVIEAATKTRAKATPKYINEAGETWSGRGRKPAWVEAAIAAGTLDNLLIKSE